MLSLPHLRLLREVHRTGSLTAAARTLNYTPSAVSQQLKLLERETGTALLEPVGREVEDAFEGLLTHEFDLIISVEYLGCPDPRGRAWTEWNCYAIPFTWPYPWEAHGPRVPNTCPISPKRHGP